MASLVKTFCNSFRRPVVLGNGKLDHHHHHVSKRIHPFFIHVVVQFLCLFLRVVMAPLIRIKVNERKNMIAATTVNLPMSPLLSLSKCEMLLWAYKHQVRSNPASIWIITSTHNVVIETQDTSITLSDNLISESLTPLINDSELFSALFPSITQPSGEQSSDQVRQLVSSQEFQRALSTLRVACENGELNTVASEIGLGSSAHNSKYSGGWFYKCPNH